MEIEGKIIRLMPVQNITGQKGSLKKLEFVIETEAKYPRKVCFSLWNDKVDIFSSLEGDKVKVFFDIESREYNGRWFTEAKAWKVENANSESKAGFNEPYKNDFPNLNEQKEELDDLPF